MEIIIYGKEGCTLCDKTRMLCQIQSRPFQYLTVGSDITVEGLQAKVSEPVRSLPQIFVQQGGAQDYVGGYDALRDMLKSGARQQAAAY
ncbi:MAG: hypothetical protein ACTS8S_15065 [Giesbergeria sp.]